MEVGELDKYSEPLEAMISDKQGELRQTILLRDSIPEGLEQSAGKCRREVHHAKDCQSNVLNAVHSKAIENREE